MKITKNTIKRLEKELQEETKDMKRRSFLKATINLYSKKLGMKPPYEF